MNDLLRAVLLVALLVSLACDSVSSPVAPGGTTLVVSANPKSIGLAGSSNVTVTAIHSSGVPARSGTEILLTSTLGTIETVARTDDDGIARAVLHAEGRAGTAVITARSGAATPVTVDVVIGGTETLPTADFEFSAGETLTVVFSDTSTGNPTSREWRFGDGTVSIERDPVHTYVQPGSYLVTLRVGNANGEDSVSKQVVVPSSQGTAPVAKFEADVNGFQAVFTDQSTGSIASWDWSFGDGDRSTVQHPVHVYREPGVYSVTLTVRNAAGTSTASRSIAVPESQLPVAGFAFRETADLRLLFRDTSTNQPTRWQWDFGDGGRSSVQNPAHTFARTGTYTVTLTVSNLAGSSTATQFVTVRGPLVADFQADVNGLTVAFTDRSEGDPTTFLWTFGDGTAQSSSQNPDHTYTMAGTYTVTLTVTRPAISDTPVQQASTTKTVVVAAPAAQGVK